MHRRLGTYLSERFPLELVLVQAVSYTSAMLYGKATAHGGTLNLSFWDFAPVVALWSYFLLARVLDEYKDYEFDVVYLPDRPLPRGAISWREVNAIGTAAVVVQPAVCVLVDGGIGPVCFWWAIAFSYLCLTGREFFVRDWLRGHFLTNTITHLPVYALASVWVAQIGASPDWVSAKVAWLALFSYCFTLGMDFWRKSYAPAAERPEVDSYTQRLGVTGACIAAGAALLVVSALAAVLLTAASADTAAGYAALAIVPVPALVSLALFARSPSEATNSRARNVLAATLLAELLIVISSVGLERGVAFG